MGMIRKFLQTLLTCKADTKTGCARTWSARRGFEMTKLISGPLAIKYQMDVRSPGLVPKLVGSHLPRDLWGSKRQCSSKSTSKPFTLNSASSLPPIHNIILWSIWRGQSVAHLASCNEWDKIYFCVVLYQLTCRQKRQSPCFTEGPQHSAEI